MKLYHALKKNSSELKIINLYEDGYKRTLIDKITHKLKVPIDSCNINNRILEVCEKEKPEVVFIVKGNLIKPSTLLKIKAFGAKIISWSNDDMYGWHNRSLWYTKGLKHYDLVVTQKSYNCDPKELPSLGAKVLFQDKAFEPAIHYPIENCLKTNYQHEVVFVGSRENERLEFLKYLSEHDITVNIYGWGPTQKSDHCENLIYHNRHLYGEDFNSAFTCAKISLNFLRKMNRDLQTSRSIEIPACKGFMLGERTNEHQRLFEEGQEADYFSSKKEMLEKVIYYLENDSERKQIALNGFNRCYKSKYTFEERIKGIFNELNSFPSSKQK